MLLRRNPKIFDVDLYGVFAVCILLAVTWYGALTPLAKRSVEAQNQSVELENKMSELRTRRAELMAAAEQSDRLAAQLSKTTDPLRDNTGTDQVIRLLYKLSSEQEILLDNIITHQESTSGYVRKTPLTLTLKGNFISLRNWLDQIAIDLPFVRIDTLDLTGKKDPADNHCLISMNLDIYAPR